MRNPILEYPWLTVNGMPKTLSREVQTSLRADVLSHCKETCPELLSLPLNIDFIFGRSGDITQRVQTLAQIGELSPERYKELEGEITKIRTQMHDVFNKTDTTDLQRKEELCRQFETWACNDVYNALKILAENKMTDWHALIATATSCPAHYRANWVSALANTLRQHQARSLDQNISKQEAFLLIQKNLNEEFFCGTRTLSRAQS